MNERAELEYMDRRKVEILKEIRQHKETLRRMMEADEANPDYSRTGAGLRGWRS